MTDDAPRSAADPRPGDEPYYIDTDCPECGAALELWAPNTDPVWHDEWACPECDDGIHLDWPEEALERLREEGGVGIDADDPAGSFTPMEDLE